MEAENLIPGKIYYDSVKKRDAEFKKIFTAHIGEDRYDAGFTWAQVHEPGEPSNSWFQMPQSLHPRKIVENEEELDREVTKLMGCFTNRSRKLMAFANQEAQRFNHEYIGTEHILLGLVKEGSGVGANVLKNLEVDLRKVRLEVENLLKRGPYQVTMGKLPQTPRAIRVIGFAIDESNQLGHNYIGTEHILLGLIREEGSVAAQILMNLGLSMDKVKHEVMNLLGCLDRDNETEDSGCHVQQWEYITRRYGFTTKDGMCVNLNMHGEDGWEVIQAIEVKGELQFFFKRPKNG